MLLYVFYLSKLILIILASYNCYKLISNYQLLYLYLCFILNFSYFVSHSFFRPPLLSIREACLQVSLLQALFKALNGNQDGNLAISLNYPLRSAA